MHNTRVLASMHTTRNILYELVVVYEPSRIFLWIIILISPPLLRVTRVTRHAALYDCTIIRNTVGGATPSYASPSQFSDLREIFVTV